jgi:hypothetical protein
MWVDGRPIAFLAAALWRHPSDGEPGWSVLVSEASSVMPDGEFEVRLRTRDGVALRARALLENAGEQAIKTDLIRGVGALVEIGSESN